MKATKHNTERLISDKIAVESKHTKKPHKADNDKLVKLDFMVVPEELSRRAIVPDAVRCRVVDPNAIFLTGILGDSGRKLVEGGIDFYFTRKLAERLILAGIAVESKKDE
jgi:hypothetical protein